MGWTLGTIHLDGSTGFVLATVDLGTGMVDSATIESVADWDASGPAYGDWMTLSQESTPVLYGMITAVVPYARGGGAQGRRYTLSNPWWHLERLTYMQLFSYGPPDALVSAYRSKVWMGVDAAGTARITTAQSIAQVLAYASPHAGGFSHEMGTFGAYAPVTEIVDQTCAAVILQLLRWHPNVSAFWRYSSGGAVLHMQPLSALSTVSVKVAAAGASDPLPATAEVRPRADLVPPCVVVKYERVNQEDDQLYMELAEDKAGAGAETDPGALIFTIELQGANTTTVSQPIRTRAVPDEFADDGNPATPSSGDMAKAVKWYQCHVAALRALPAALVRVDEHLKVFDNNQVEGVGEDPAGSPDPAPEGAPDDYPRELMEGTVQRWMSGVKATPMIAQGKFAWKGTPEEFAELTAAQKKIAKLVFGEGLGGEMRYHVRYMATDAVTRTYKGLGSFEGPEEAPTGLAAAVYEGLDAVRHEGTVTRRGAETPLDVLPGHKVTLDGQTGSGPVQRVSFDAKMSRATLSFGWPGHLTAQDFYELSRASRGNPYLATYNPERKGAAAPGGNASNNVEGALRGPVKDVQPVPPLPPPHPFLVQMVAGKLTVVSGLFNGHYPRLLGAVAGDGADGEHRINHVPAAAATIDGTGEEHMLLQVVVRHHVIKGYIFATDQLLDVDFADGWDADDGPAVYLRVVDEAMPSAMIADSATWDTEDPDEEATGTVDWSYTLEMCQLNDGVPQPQPIRNSLTGHWCDNGVPGEPAVPGEGEDPGTPGTPDVVRAEFTTGDAG